MARTCKGGFIRALHLAPADDGSDRVYFDEGANHVGSATRAYRDERAYASLLSKSLA